jgi:hypothetical protein
MGHQNPDLEENQIDHQVLKCLLQQADTCVISHELIFHHEHILLILLSEG